MSRADLGVVGLGYVGLPLAMLMADAGKVTLGFDIDPEKIAKLRVGQSYLGDVPSSRIASACREGRFEPTVDFGSLGACDAIVICVPTPLSRYREPDLTFVTKTVESVARTLRDGQLVVLSSTTWPGTTQEVVRPMLEATGLVAGRDFFLAFSPEREDPGRRAPAAADVPRVVGADDPRSLERVVALFEAAYRNVHRVSSTRVAELSKLLENIFRSVNIALVNELKVLCDRMGLDVWEVVAASATKPYGFMPFQPGPGLGGHCIPIDPFYLTWKAREHGISTRFIELAGEINTAMPAYVVTRIQEALNADGKCLKGSRILILGVAYKRDVGDCREAPALEIIELLRDQGADVVFHDPHVPELPSTRRYPLRLAPAVPLTADELRRAAAVAVVTDHSGIDYGLVASAASLVIDTRNVMATVAPSAARVVRA